MQFKDVLGLKTWYSRVGCRFWNLLSNICWNAKWKSENWWYHVENVRTKRKQWRCVSFTDWFSKLDSAKITHPSNLESNRQT